MPPPKADPIGHKDRKKGLGQALGQGQDAHATCATVNRPMRPAGKFLRIRCCQPGGFACDTFPT
jgi:hypothetical protein